MPIFLPHASPARSPHHYIGATRSSQASPTHSTAVPTRPIPERAYSRRGGVARDVPCAGSSPSPYPSQHDPEPRLAPIVPSAPQGAPLVRHSRATPAPRAAATPPRGLPTSPPRGPPTHPPRGLPSRQPRGLPPSPPASVARHPPPVAVTGRLSDTRLPFHRPPAPSPRAEWSHSSCPQCTVVSGATVPQTSPSYARHQRPPPSVRALPSTPPGGCRARWKPNSPLPTRRLRINSYQYWAAVNRRPPKLDPVDLAVAATLVRADASDSSAAAALLGALDSGGSADGSGDGSGEHAACERRPQSCGWVCCGRHARGAAQVPAQSLPGRWKRFPHQRESRGSYLPSTDVPMAALDRLFSIHPAIPAPRLKSLQEPKRMGRVPVFWSASPCKPW